VVDAELSKLGEGLTGSPLGRRLSVLYTGRYPRPIYRSLAGDAQSTPLAQLHVRLFAQRAQQMRPANRARPPRPDFVSPTLP
jgi:hypothetical protein